MTATALNYTTAHINANYRIKVSGIDNDGKRIHKLVGCSGLFNLIGAELMNKFIARAERSMEDSTECKLRRGLKVTFYNK
jgi:hypothetical protein